MLFDLQGPQESVCGIADEPPVPTLINDEAGGLIRLD